MYQISNMINNLQEISDKVLYRVINESDDVNWNFLALKVMISRFKLKLLMIDCNKINQREEMIVQCCTEMRELFLKCKNIPNAKRDIQTIKERFLDRKK